VKRLVGLLYTVLMVWPVHTAAQTASPTIETIGTVTHVQPYAVVTVDRSAYIAVFEFRPGAGAVLLYPSDTDNQCRHEPGQFRFPLNSHQVSAHRDRFYKHLDMGALMASGTRDRAYLLAVTSEYPFRFDDLLGTRVYQHIQSHEDDDMVRDLIGVVADTRDTSIGRAVHSFPKLRVRDHSPILDPPYLTTQGGQ